MTLDPEKIRRLADRFDWAFEVEGDVIDLDDVAHILREVADDRDLDVVADALGLPCEEPRLNERERHGDIRR